MTRARRGQDAGPSQTAELASRSRKVAIVIAAVVRVTAPHKEEESSSAVASAVSSQESSTKMSLSERRQLRVASIQAVVAVVALIISTYTIAQQVHLNRQQLQLNEQQHRLNEYSAMREERKYSTRVAMWSAPGDAYFSSVLPRGINLSIQNRSPVPLRNVHVRATLASGHVGGVSLPEMPPCTIRRYRIAPPEGEGFKKDNGRFARYVGLSLYFWVDNNYWLLTSDNLKKSVEAEESGSTRRLRGYPVESFDPNPNTNQNEMPQAALVQDCGEGG